MIESLVPQEYICKTCGFPTDSPNHELGCKVLAEEIVRLTLPQAAEQALWDLRQWTKDHPTDCECFTCGDTIPDLMRSLDVQRPPCFCDSRL